MVPRVVRVARERLPLDRREIDDAPSFVAPLTTSLPTVSDGSGTSCVIVTMSDGAFCGWMSICEPKRHALDDERRDRDDGPVDRRVDVVPGGAPTSSAEHGAAVELVPGREPPPPPKTVEHALHEPFVPLVAERIKRERAVVGRVVADRGRRLCEIGICRRTEPCSATICGTAGSRDGAGLPRDDPRGRVALPPKADSASATRKIAAER